jgi:nicotinate-nucleotide pyrophosphorylase (carboxylating)
METYFDPPITAVRDIVAAAFREDLTPLGDVTSVLLPPAASTSARFIAREPGVLAGTRCAEESFWYVDSAIQIDWRHRDGAAVNPGDVLGVVSGRLASVLTAERTALNLLCHLSGVATCTSEYVRAVAHTEAQVWDTRKTTPGLRSLEKSAVRAGGGRNHRGNLSDWMLVKDNHLTGLGVREAVLRCADAWPGRMVHVECERLDQMREAIEAGAHAVLLDNMSVEEVRECVAVAREMRPGTRAVLIECSGGITLDTIAAYASTGVDHISVGRITNSAPVLDIGLDISVEDSGGTDAARH